MYFLLSCYTGYRLSDVKQFDYRTMVHGQKISLRAEKNGKIVSLLIHSKLREVLNYCKDHPLALSEEKTREYVKDLSKLAGIEKEVSFIRRGRFAMLLMAKRFMADEVAELIGDTPPIRYMPGCTMKRAMKR